MATRDEIEAMLVKAFAVEPSAAGLRLLDERFARLTTEPVAARSVLTPGRLVLRPLLILAAFLLLAGGVAAALSLLDRTVESSGMPGLIAAWDRAERLGIKQTDAGVTITLERAYADLNGVLVGFTVEGLPAAPVTGHGEAFPIEWRAELRDPEGRTSQEWADSGLGLTQDETGLSAIVERWEGSVGPMPGTWELTFSAVGYNSGGLVSGECTVGNTDPSCSNPPPPAMVDGTWRFAFELPMPAGTIVSPAATATVGAATVTLDQLRITPSMIVARLALRLSGGEVADWRPTMSITGEGKSYVINGSTHLTQDPNTQGPDGDVNEVLTTAGADVATGTWQIEISDLTYRSSIQDPTGDELHLAGPWTFTVVVP